MTKKKGMTCYPHKNIFPFHAIGHSHNNMSVDGPLPLQRELYLGRDQNLLVTKSLIKTDNVFLNLVRRKRIQIDSIFMRLVFEMDPIPIL